jgi:hypothetical protein
MWSCARESLNDVHAERYVPLCNGSPIPYSRVLGYWQDEATFRSFFLSLLSDAPFAAYRWETPPITKLSAGRAFEFALLDAPGLEQPPDDQAFAEHFHRATADQDVVTFQNLGKDAVLVVPCPLAKGDGYAHLAAFVRAAPVAQQHELWRAVGAAMQARLGQSPVWLSTAGMGVPWLHVRLDSRPKYYAFNQYRDAS